MNIRNKNQLGWATNYSVVCILKTKDRDTNLSKVMFVDISGRPILRALSRSNCGLRWYSRDGFKDYIAGGKNAPQR